MTTKQKQNKQKKYPKGSIPILPDSKVIGLFGSRGSGKSALMCKFGIDAAEAGRQVFYYPEEYGFKYISPKYPDIKPISMSPAELVQVPEELNNSTILLDEIQELMSKYRSNTTATQMLLAFFRQVRKRGSNIIFTSNDPNNINNSIAPQTNYHMYLKMYPDQRCNRKGYHNPYYCLDTVFAEVRHTQKGAEGYPSVFTRISRMYQWYDTTSIAKPADVMSITKAKVMEQNIWETTGKTKAEVLKIIEDAIINLVNNGYTSVAPRGLSKILREEKKIILSSDVIGKAINNLNPLEKKRKSSGMSYELPPKDKLQEWIDGLYDTA